MLRFPLQLIAAVIVASLLLVGCGDSDPNATVVLDNGPTVTYPNEGTAELNTIMGGGGPYHELTYTHDGKTIVINKFSISVDGNAQRLEDPQGAIVIELDGTFKLAE